jgi:ATP-dependent DNA helicase DinG
VPVRAVVLKGYDHYLCLRKFARLWDGEDLSRAALALAAMVTVWVADSDWDELDSLNVHALGELEEVLRASQASCLKERCRFAREGTCFMWGQRRRASAAHLLIVNHALLLANVRCEGSLYPSSRYLIIDEAHQLEEEAREALAMEISRQRTSGVLGKLASTHTRLWPESVKLPAADEDRLTARGHVMAASARDAMSAVKGLFAAVSGLAEVPRGTDGQALWLSGEFRDTEPDWHEVVLHGEVALEAMSAAVHALQLALGDAAAAAEHVEDPGLAFAEALADLNGWCAKLGEAAGALEAVLTGAGDDYVYEADIQRRPGWEDERLVAELLDVGDALQEDLFSAQHSVVCTSATLSAGDDFAHFLAGVGLDRAERRPELLAIPSPFDYEAHMRVFVVTDLPEPNDPAYLGRFTEFLADLHRAVGGGTLTLFTKRSDMESVHEVLSPLLAEDGLALLCQGRGVSKRRLAEEFRADERASLLATRSFWDGFDAPGDTLRAVVIARLPFGYLADPLSEALKARIGESRWWRQHYLPRAVLDLKQAAGRLIRSASDEGYVILADSRLAAKWYGKRFLAALPTGARSMGGREIIASITGKGRGPKAGRGAARGKSNGTRH